MAEKKTIYCFISDEANLFYRAIQQVDGSYIITKSGQPYPISHNPPNLLDSEIEFATNRNYNGLFRSISYPLEFNKDSAAILRELYFLRKGTETKAYLTIVEWNGVTGVHELSYTGRFDFAQKSEDPKAGVFTVPTLDDSAWGVLSQNDDVEYAIECNATNPKAIRVLLDGITLLNRYTYQTVQAPFTVPPSTTDFAVTMPFVLINQDGDSVGIVTKNQTVTPIHSNGVAGNYVPVESPSWFFQTLYPINNVGIQGSLDFICNTTRSDGVSSGLRIFFVTSTNQVFFIYNRPQSGQTIIGKRYSIDINITLNLAVGESIWLIAAIGGQGEMSVTPIVTNIAILTKTIQQPSVVYSLRPLDLLQAVVSKATRGRYTIQSSFFEVNNKSVLTSGDAIRGIDTAKIYTSFKDFFDTFNAEQFMALRIINGQLWMEKAVEVYKKDSTIIDIGDAIDIQLIPAQDWICNEIEVGSPKVDLRHPSGRFEFNSTNTFSLPFLNTKKKLDLVTKYRLGCYDIMFLLLDYKGSSSTDNTGDKKVFQLEIVDDVVSAKEDLETFENVNIVAAPLAPIIKYPLNNSVVNFNRPVIRGIAPPGETVLIYIFDTYAGSVDADTNGNWSYSIPSDLASYNPGIATGINIIKATYTDLGGATDEISIVIDTTVTCPTEITYPSVSDSLFNNKPLIKGIAQNGVAINIFLDGVLWGTTVADASCGWQYKSQVIPNGDHILTVNGIDPTPIHVDSNVAFPLITYVGSELDGFPIINNLPLIQGVALPGTPVVLFLDYISYSGLNYAVITDANGNWSVQLAQIGYNDPLTGLTLYLAPITNGLHIISTSLQNHLVGINVLGYKLNRPAYDSITGVPDNTVFNTTISPKRMLLNHAPVLSAIMNQQRQEMIEFQTADKNSNLRTVLGTEIIVESDDIPVDSLGEPIALLEYALVKTKARHTFAKTLYNFNNGGIVKTNFRGNDLFMLPMGSMKMASIADSQQEWKLLLSPANAYTTLLSLYKQGITITLMRNSIYHSDYNSLHWVTYNYVQPTKYNFKEIYDDWFESRNDAWLLNPEYIQKFQRGDLIKDQIITNGVTGVTLDMYRCRDVVQVASFPYIPVTPAPIPVPDIVLEATIDLSAYPEDRYFFVAKLNSTDIGGNTLFVTVAAGDILTERRYTLTGTPRVGDVVTFTTNQIWAYVVVPGDTIVSIINAMYALITGTPAYILTKINSNTGLLIISPFVSFASFTVTHPGVLNLAITEKIQTKDKWLRTILIESSNSINLTGAFFSTGFQTVVRVEGLVKKLQPSVSSNVAIENDGDSQLLYSQITRARIVRFGTAYGLPDYLYLKIAAAIALDGLFIEGVGYSLAPDEKIQASDDIDGHPLYYYNVELLPRANMKGNVFPGLGDGVGAINYDSVVLVVDATAFGLPVGSLINIEMDNG